MIPGQASKKTAAVAQSIYEKIVGQARHPVLYTHYAIPDTIDGRFDAILLHASLVIHFLAHSGESGQSIAQQLFDTMFRDFNHNLRHIGIGDMSLARHFRRMSEGFNGRLRAYADAFQAEDEARMHDAIARNIYRNQSITLKVKTLSEYVWLQFKHLSSIDINKLHGGKFEFASPETV